MNTLKKIFALALLLTVQAQISAAEPTTLPNTNLRVIALNILGVTATAYSASLVYTIINKIIETDPTIDETTLHQKVITTLRYGFGITAGLIGTALGVYAIVNSNKDPFIA